MSFELYAFKSSFYSVKAQLALRAKGIEYSVIEVNLMTYENLRPWYLRINPAGKVPTLRHDDSIVSDSSVIISYLDKINDGSKLQPDMSKEPGKSVRQLFKKIDSIKMNLLTLGTILDLEATHAVNLNDRAKRKFRENVLNNREKDVLETLLNENPEMTDYYKDRLKAAQDFDPKAVFSRQNMKQAKEDAFNMLQEAEQQLKQMDRENQGRPSWLFGLEITAPDVALVTTLFRLSNLGLDKELWVGKLPKLEKYFTFAKENFPGFKTVTANAF